jgi:predicted DNA-binding protein (MmcQ/YjbR family)
LSTGIAFARTADTHDAMRLPDFNAFCASLAHTTHVVQWEGAQVWKVAGKMFAIGSRWDARMPEGDFLNITFKCSPMSYDILKEQDGLRPAPYLASRGMKWIQRTSTSAMDDNALKDYLRESWRLVAAGLPKRVQVELGLPVAPRPQRSKGGDFLDA